MYALIEDGKITRFGTVEQRGDVWQVIDGDTITGHATEAEVADLGWHEVVDADRPADTATTTHDRTIEVVKGVPTVVWTERAKTTDEQAAKTQQATRSTLEQAVKDHLSDLRTIRNSTGTLTGAQLSNAVRALAKGQAHVIRLLIGALDSTD